MNHKKEGNSGKNKLGEGDKRDKRDKWDKRDKGDKWDKKTRLNIHNNVELHNVLVFDESKQSNQNGITSEEYMSMEFNKDPLLLNLKNNYLFYFSLLVSIYFICKKDNSSFLLGILNLIVISGLGYYVHYRAHTLNVTKFYETSNNYFTRNKYLDFISRLTCYFLDFHETIHHDSSINKKPVYVLIEFIMNFLTQGGYVFIFYILFKLVNLKVAFMWGMLYSTIHLFNYEFVKPETHILHHKNKLTNLGLDIWDVLFNTKYEYDNYKAENINHAFINVGVLSWFLTKCL